MSFDISRLPKILELSDQISKRFFEIPFGHSRFQNEHFIINAQLTPARAYRAIGLELMSRLNSLRENYFKYQQNLVDIEELEDKLANGIENKFEKKRAELKLQEKKAGAEYLMKLVSDSAIEVETFMEHMQKFPEYTREQFEREEAAHYTKRLQLQASGVTGALESMFHMGLNTSEIADKVLQQPDYKPVLQLLKEKVPLLNEPSGS